MATEDPFDELKANVKRLRVKAEQAEMEAEELRFDRNANFEVLKAAIAKATQALADVEDARSALDKAQSNARISAIANFSESLQSAVGAIFSGEVLEQLRALQVNGYNLSVDLTPEAGTTVSARAWGEFLAQTPGEGDRTRFRSSFDGKTAREFVATRGGEMWGAARLARILGDSKNIGHYARALAKHLGITPQPSDVTSDEGDGTRFRSLFDGKTAREFVATRGGEMWDAAILARILDDRKHINDRARTLAMRLGISPQHS